MRLKNIKKRNFFSFLILIVVSISNVLGQRAQVYVDFAKPLGVKSMSGFLHGLDNVKPPDKLILPLQPKQWRISETDPAIYDRLKKSGARTQIVLSDFWGYPGLSTNRPWPFHNYNQFEDFVRRLALEHKATGAMWDVWNEPEDPKLPYWKGTFEQFCETYRRAYNVLRRELGPEALIGGPSFSRYDRALLTKFLDFCRTNKCEVNFLSWHELDEATLTGIPDRLSDARRLFLDNPKYSSLKIKEIQINEIVGGGAAQYSPGIILGYFYFLEKGGADGASKACWNNSLKQSNCDNGALDGLVTENFQPRAAWWTYKKYADGVDSRVAGSTTDPHVTVLASSRSGAASQAQILIGFFQKTPDDPAETTVSVKVDNIDRLSFIAGDQKARIKIEKIPYAAERAIKRLELISEKEISLSNASVQIALGKISANEVYAVTIAKAR